MLPANFPKWAIFFTTLLCGALSFVLIALLGSFFPTIGAHFLHGTDLGVVGMLIIILAPVWIVHHKIFMHEVNQRFF